MTKQIILAFIWNSNEFSANAALATANAIRETSVKIVTGVGSWITSTKTTAQGTSPAY